MVSRVVVYLFMAGMIVSGTVNTVAIKLTYTRDARGSHFEHPYFQTAFMFLGETLCFLFYFYIQYMEKQNGEDNPKESLFQEERSDGGDRSSSRVFRRFGKKLFAIPALFDLCGSSLMNIGLVLAAPSIYQMMRGAIIVIVAVYSIIFLKRSLYRHQVLGVVLTTFGVTIIGFASVLYQASSARNPVLGIILLIAGQLLAGGFFVSEEKLLRKITVHPLQIVGIEGVSGVIYFIILLPILNLIPCDSDDLCYGGYVDNSVEAFRQIAANWQIPMLLLLTMVSIAVFNWTGVSTTKYASAIARSVVDTLRTLLVWGVSLIIGWEEFLWMQLIGFFVLVVGSVIYNEILILPFWGFKEAVAKHQESQK